MIGTADKHIFTGGLFMWCGRCGSFRQFVEDGRGGCTCTLCGERPTRLRCNRCGHEWTPRTHGRLPGYCPVCKTPYWNRMKTKGRRKANGDDDL